MTKLDLLKEISYLESKLRAKENAIHVLKMQNLDLFLKLEKYKRKNKKR